MYCEKCCRIFDGDRCPHCKRSRVREPEPKDPCFLTEQDYLPTSILEDVLNQNGIPFLKKGVMGAGLAIKAGPVMERTRFYVSYDRLEQAMAVVEELFSVEDGDDGGDMDDGGAGDGE